MLKINLLLVNYIFLDLHMCRTSRFNILYSLKKKGVNVSFYACYLNNKFDNSYDYNIFQQKLPKTKFLKYIYYIIITSLNLISIDKKNNIDILFIDPYSVIPSIPIFIKKKIFGKKLKIILDFRSGIFHFRREKYLDLLLDKYTSLIVKISQVICNGYTFITPELHQYIVSKYSIMNKKYSYWSSAVSEEFVTAPLSLIENFDKTPIKILYHGSLGPDRGLLEIILSMKKIESINLPVKLYIAGSGELKEKMSALITELNLKNIEMLGVLNQAEVIDLINKVDGGIVVLSDILPMRTSSPLKLMEYLALNKPVIITDLPNYKFIIENNKNSLVLINDNMPDSIANGIEYFVHNVTQLKIEASNSRNFIINNYLWDMQAERLNKFILSICDD